MDANATHIYKSHDFYHQSYIDEDDPILEELAAFRLGVLANGYEPIPARGKGSKGGLHNGWTSGEITPERVRYETSIGTSKLNTGIRCGHIAVPDNDVKNPEHAAALNELIEHFLGTSPLKRRGSKGAAYCYYNRTPIKKLTLTDANDTRLFEILGDGQQFVAYGMHPDGMDYAWIGKGEPATVPLTELPEVTAEQLIELHAAIRELLTELGYQFKTDEPRTDKPGSATTTHDNEDEDIPALCRAALAVIPNDCDREEWVKMCYAIRDAGLDFEDWQQWCNKWHRPHKRGSVEAAWDSCKTPRSVTFRTLLEKADKAEPGWRSRYYAPINKVRYDAYWEAEMRRVRAEMSEFDDAPDFDNEPLEDPADDFDDDQPHQGPRPTQHPLIWDAGEQDDSWIPPRQWLLANIICRRFLTLLFGPGGAGKSSIVLTFAMSLAVAKALIGEHVFQRCRVLYVSMEDDQDEMQRRIKACRIHHGVDRDDLKGWFFVYNISKGKKLATVNNKGAIVEGKLAAELTEIIQQQKIDVIILDPFKKTHGCPENDNTAIDQVADLLTNMAIELDIAALVLHHVAKGRNEAGDPDVGRGASALKDAARLGFTLTPMAEAEAAKVGVNALDRWAYVRLDPAKVNIAPRAIDAKWFKLVGVSLDNKTTIYPNGDNVQTIEQTQLGNIDDLRNNKKLLDAVFILIILEPGKYSEDARVADPECQVLQFFHKIDETITAEQAKQLIGVWLHELYLEKVDYGWMDNSGRTRRRKGLKIGKWANKVFDEEEIRRLQHKSYAR